MTRIVTAPTVTKDQNRSGVGIVILSALPPPLAQTVTGKLTGIATGTDIDEAMIGLQIIEGVRDHHALGKRGEVMIIGGHFPGVYRVPSR